MLRWESSVGNTTKVLVISSAGLILALLVAGLSLNVLFGIRFKRGGKYRDMESAKINRRPAAVVRVVDPESLDPVIQDSVPIQALNDIYASVGVTSADFASWQRRYGMDSLGTASDGTIFVSGFPVLSKIAWMYVDPVTLTPLETLTLIQECKRAASHAVSDLARQELLDICTLAGKALDKHAVVRFGM